jgi:hypothetical protein
MPEEQDIPKQSPEEESSSDPNLQESFISSSETQPPNMEVHHHPDLHHKRKHFREYVLEFFMIFLAVTMGFFAENIREGITENAKAKEFAQSLYGDLKKDTSFLNLILSYKLWRGSKIDSLISILDSENVQKSAKLIYYYHSAVDGNISFHPTDVTIQQLRNSGGLRYFKNGQLYNAIARYYGDINFYKEMEYARYLRVPFNLSSNIFSSEVLMSTESMTPDPRDALHMPAGNPQLLTTDKHILNEYLLYVGNQKQANELSIMLLQGVEKNLNELMGDLQKEYNLH